MLRIQAVPSKADFKYGPRRPVSLHFRGIGQSAKEKSCLFTAGYSGGDLARSMLYQIKGEKQRF
jgi:hypothetical protein